MHRFLLTLALAACALPAIAGNSAPNVYQKESMTGAPGACQGSTFVDASHLRYTALAVTPTAAAKIACSPRIEATGNGTVRFGGVLSNNSTTSNVVVTCTAWISSGGAGPKPVTRSVIVSPKSSARIEWGAYDMGTRVLIGGQSGFECVLKPGTSLSWIWSTSVSN